MRQIRARLAIQMIGYVEGEVICPQSQLHAHQRARHEILLNPKAEISLDHIRVDKWLEANAIWALPQRDGRVVGPKASPQCRGRDAAAQCGIECVLPV